MLYLAYLGEARNIIFNENSKKVLIVRSPQGNIPEGFNHEPQLSPSPSLFKNAQEWKHNRFTSEERAILQSHGVSWKDKDAWWALYEGLFMEEIKSRPDMVMAIKKLKLELEEGQDIYLFCYCKDVNRCHRGLLGKSMEADGFEVDFRDASFEENDIKQMTLFDFDIMQ